MFPVDGVLVVSTYHIDCERKLSSKFSVCNPPPTACRSPHTRNLKASANREVLIGRPFAESVKCIKDASASEQHGARRTVWIAVTTPRLTLRPTDS